MMQIEKYSHSMNNTFSYKSMLMCQCGWNKKQDKNIAIINELVLTMYRKILKSHSQLEDLLSKKYKKTTIQSLVTNQIETVQNHNNFMKICKHVRLYSHKKNMYFAKFHNRLVLNAMFKSQVIYEELDNVFKYTQVEYVYGDYLNKLRELILMHVSIDKCL